MGVKNARKFLYINLLSALVILVSTILSQDYRSKLAIQPSAIQTNNSSVGINSEGITFKKTNVKNESTNKVVLVLVGDVMLGRTVMGKAYELGDFSYPFRQVAQKLSDSDIVFANLENPIVKDCPFTEKSMIFCSTPEMIEGLKLSGINVVNLANNHTGNYGDKGINSTIAYLNDANIGYTGRGELLIKEVSGISLGFLGFNYTFGESADIIEKDLQLIKNSDPKVDHLIVGVHWGQEYQAVPNDFQKDLAKRMISSGADIISGHHPHWIQTTDFINGKPVYYSLGNFVFDQMWSEETKKGMVIKLLMDKEYISEIEREEVYMKDWAQPQFLSD
ncbi:CapA family protein [Candidatus Woesebacteria bacterium]|nr:CapA family protein [Candidatus Woesebacteria bacterium]